jgi:hypothetical protein
MLIELFIVAAIIVVLPSILLPVFAHAREIETVQFFVVLTSGRSDKGRKKLKRYDA